MTPRTTFPIALVFAIVMLGTHENARAQTPPATGAVWVDANGNLVGPALGNQGILLKIPSVGNIVLLVNQTVYPTVPGDPIRWKYTFSNINLIPSFTLVMSFESPDCSGQGYLYGFTHAPTIGSTVVVSQFFDSVNHWLVVGTYPAVDPAPHFNSQLVQGGAPDRQPLSGPGAYCQTVDVRQGGPSLPVTHVIDQQTLASPPMTLQ